MQLKRINQSVDFSGSIPNPYIGKVRRETMEAVANKDAKDWTLDEREAAAVSNGVAGVRKK